MRRLLAASSLCALVFAILLLLCPMASAQLGSGQVEGTITDSSGAHVSGAQVTVKNTAGTVTRDTRSDSEGRYRAISLIPGTYTVTIQHTGFQIIELTGVEVIVGTTTTVDVVLKVAATKETVTVEASAPVIDTENTQVTSTVPKEVVGNVPVIGRRWDNYVLLTPGVTTDGTFGLITYRGISGLYNNNTVDGADNNQAFFSEARGRTRAVYTYSQAAVKEFQVGLSNFTAEYGRAAGGSVNAVTKSGSNNIHGEAFWFIRDSGTNAAEPFAAATALRVTGDPTLPERRQQFGFALGGPIKKNKLFWFLNYDQQVRNFPYVVSTSDPNFISLCPGATVVTTSSCPGSPAPAKSPVTDCSVITDVNQRTTCTYMLGLATVVPRKALNNVAFGKLDWLVSDKHTITGSYNYHKWRSVNGVRTPLINFNAATDNGYDFVRTDSVVGQWSWTITSHALNEFRFQFARDNEAQNPNAPGPGTSVTGGFSFGQPNFLPRGQFPFEKRFQWVDNISLIHGRHTFKFGADINYVRDSQQNLFQGGGVYSFSNFVNLAKDCPPGAVALGCVPAGTFDYSSFTEAFELRPGTVPGFLFFTTTDYNFYAQDTFKIRNDMTLNYGLRYEYQHLPQPSQGNPAFPLTQRFNQDNLDFGPRIGFAWDLGNHHTTILRVGYGLIFGRTSNSQIATAMLNNGLTNQTLVWSSTSNSATRPLYPNCFVPGVNAPCTLPVPGSAAGSRPDISEFAPDFKRPMVHQIEFTLEHEIARDTVVSLTYAYSGGRRLPIYNDVNLPPAAAEVFINVNGALLSPTQSVLASGGVFGPFPFYCNGFSGAGSFCPTGAVNSNGRPNGTVNRIIQAQSIGNSDYSGLILALRRNMNRGMYLYSHFTFAKAIDDGQNSVTFFERAPTQFDPANPGFDRARSDFDVNARWVTTFVWRPGDTWSFENGVVRGVFNGLALSGALTVQGGRPVTPTLSGFLSSGVFAIDNGSSNGTGGGTTIDSIPRAPFIGRNQFTSPGFSDFDFRISKDIRVTEGTRFQLIAESFNLFNSTNITSVNTTAYFLGSNTLITIVGGNCGGVPVPQGARCLTVSPSSTFMAPRSASSTLNSMREFQFAVKFAF